jgi:heparanase
MKIALVLVLAGSSLSLKAQEPLQLNLQTLPKVGTVDARFQSYNVEMVEVVGGRFWKPYASKEVTAATPSKSATPGGIDPNLFEQRTPINLEDTRLRKLAAALGPAYMRVSGTWANTLYFQDTDATVPAAPPEGFGGVLTRAEWKRVVDFAKNVDAELVTSFATSVGTRDKDGVWTPIEAKKFLDYTHSIGGEIAAAEFMNEPTFVTAAGVPKGYDAAAYGRDFAVFQPFFRQASPRSVLLGPGSVGEGIDFVPVKLLPSKELLAAMGPNAVDAFSYHFYGTISERCAGPMGGGKVGTTPAAALTEDWLSRTGTVEQFYAKLRDEYAPGKAMWLTETGQTACGGDRWASTFLDSFRYVDQMGQLAKLHVQTIMHNTLAASDYGLIDEKTLLPRPDYWAALLWHRTMGTTVLSAGPGSPDTVHLYAHCMKDKPGGVTLLALNLNRTEPARFDIPAGGVRFTLTANDLMGRTVELNGKELMVAPNGDLPEFQGSPVKKGKMVLPPASISFVEFAGAANAACR